jgi:hypothetical protein
MDGRFYRTMFLLAAIWNFIVAAGGLFSYEAQFRLLFGQDAYTGDFHQALLYRAFAIAVLLFGVGYYLVSREPSENRGIVWLGAAGKIVVFALITDAFVQGQATLPGWCVSIGDLTWALLFFWFLYQTKDRVRVSNLLG